MGACVAGLPQTSEGDRAVDNSYFVKYSSTTANFCRSSDVRSRISTSASLSIRYVQMVLYRPFLHHGLKKYVRAKNFCLLHMPVVRHM